MKSKFLIIPVIVFLFAFTLSPVLADGNDKVYNDNFAMVTNMVEVEAETGENFADGSYGGSGGDGGSVYNGSMPHPVLYSTNSFNGGGDNHDGDEGGDVEESTTGDGGAGGNASDGGTVITGDATAELRLTTKANRNLTEINRCGCPADEETRFNDDGNSRVRNINKAIVFNGPKVEAETGDNSAMGSYAGSGGEGGDIKNNDGDVDEVFTGNGGIGGDGALGGLIQTGLSTARGEIVNRINENVTRITR